MSCEQHGPPRSLRGSQDAETIWATIAQRFPTAAPLLCEMEEIIDRAEELLQQLRAPFHRDDARPSSPAQAESRESLALLSARDSFDQEQEEPVSARTEHQATEIEMFESSETEMEPSLDSLKSDTLDLCEELSSDVNVGASSLDMGDHKVESSDNETLSAALQGSGDEGQLKYEGPTRPAAILQAYAKRCEVQLEYHFRRRDSKRVPKAIHVISAKLGGYKEESIGNTKQAAKNSVAGKLLVLIANQQMNSEKLTLPELTRHELLQILEFAATEIRDTPQTKLYRLCLEKDLHPPEYRVKKQQTMRGTTYMATCTASSFTGNGVGHGEDAAKKAAAEDLYRQTPWN